LIHSHIQLWETEQKICIPYSNDAATAIAEHIAGSTEDFAVLMNEYAARIGAMNTNFTNPHGLADDEHYTTALDLALIAAYGLNIPKFAEIVATRRKVVSWEGREYGRTLNNSNRMLYLYEGSTGVKTGFTRATGRTLVSSAVRTFEDDVPMQLIAVTLNAPSDWADHAAMLDYGFYNYAPRVLAQENEPFGSILVTNGEADVLPLKTAARYIFPLRADEELTAQVVSNVPQSVEAPIVAGERLGNITVTVDGVEFSDYPIFAGASVERRKSALGGVVPPTEQSFGERFVGNVFAVFADWVVLVAGI